LFFIESSCDLVIKYLSYAFRHADCTQCTVAQGQVVIRSGVTCRIDFASKVQTNETSLKLIKGGMHKQALS